MSTVYFASAKVSKLSPDASLPAKFVRLLKKSGFGSQVKDKSVAIKMHIGGHLGFTTIHPLFVRFLVDHIKENGGRPFITDVMGWDVRRGYTPEVIGCQFYPANGLRDSNYFVKKMPDGYGLKELQMSGIIKAADYLVNLSHLKGHGCSSYGGALKNLGMGFVTGQSRMQIHNTVAAKPFWTKSSCKKCMLCIKNCRNDSIKFGKTGDLEIDFHNCYFCMRCVAACPSKALKFDDSKYKVFQKALVLSAKSSLEEFKGGAFHINVIMNVTPFCDCWGYSTPSIIPDVGITASQDIVAVEKSSLDLIDKEKYIKGSLPGHLKLQYKKGHLFYKVWGKDPYILVNESANLKMGQLKYDLETIS
jgi:hypothetical protein